MRYSYDLLCVYGNGSYVSVPLSVCSSVMDVLWLSVGL